MRRLFAASALILAILAALPSTVSADASCDAVVSDLPILTGNIQTEWVVDTCSARTSIRVTLSELRNGDWERADCDGGVDNCTIVRPTTSQDCGDGTLFCAYSTIHRVDVWNQAGDPCARQWRTKVVVRNPSGDVIAQDVSPANTC
jgi:hypothetical protein